jgi:hypothetical protein
MVLNWFEEIAVLWPALTWQGDERGKQAEDHRRVLAVTSRGVKTIPELVILALYLSVSPA